MASESIRFGTANTLPGPSGSAMIVRKPLIAGVRTIAFFEAAKGALVLLAGLGLLTLLHRDLQAIAENIVRHSHLDPASRYPRIFLDAARHVTNGRLWGLAGGAALYSLVRFIEAYGLWKGRRWAEWFALISSGLYLPVEAFELWHRATAVKSAILIVNIAVVVAMTVALLHSREQDGELASV